MTGGSRNQCAGLLHLTNARPGIKGAGCAINSGTRWERLDLQGNTDGGEHIKVDHGFVKDSARSSCFSGTGSMSQRLHPRSEIPSNIPAEDPHAHHLA